MCPIVGNEDWYRSTEGSTESRTKSRTKDSDSGLELGRGPFGRAL